MKIKKKVLAIVLAVMMTLTLVAPVFAAPNHWANVPLQHFESLGVLTPGSYNPDDQASRKLVCEMIKAELGNPQVAITKSFSDTNSTSILTVASVLDLAGYPDGTFKPNTAITRGEVATMLGNKNSLSPVTPVVFRDVIPTWCRDGVFKAANVGLIVGYPDTTFRAERWITIAEAATIVSKWRLLIDQGKINAPCPIPDPPPVADPVNPDAPAIPAPPPVTDPGTNGPGSIPAPPPVTDPGTNGPGSIPAPPPVTDPGSNNGPGSIPTPGSVVDPGTPGPGAIPDPPPIIDPGTPGAGDIPAPGTGSTPGTNGPGTIPDPPPVVTDPANPGPGEIPYPYATSITAPTNGPGAIPDPN